MSPEEAERIAAPVIETLLALSQEDREEVLEAVKEAVCLKCADPLCSGWCDYDSRPE